MRWLEAQRDRRLETSGRIEILLRNVITGKCWNDEPHQSFDQKEKKSSNAEAFHPTNCGTFSFAWFFHISIK
jgi:hypothetical protein